MTHGKKIGIDIILHFIVISIALFLLPLVAISTPVEIDIVILIIYAFIIAVILKGLEMLLKL